MTSNSIRDEKANELYKKIKTSCSKIMDERNAIIRASCCSNDFKAGWDSCKLYDPDVLALVKVLENAECNCGPATDCTKHKALAVFRGEK